MGEKLNSLQADNERQTRHYSKGLLTFLKTLHLDPVLQQLQGKEAAKVSYVDIIRGYNKIKEEYEDSAKGAKNVIAAVFQEFHPVSQHFHDSCATVKVQFDFCTFRKETIY